MLNTRQKNTLLNIVASPFFLALPIAVFIILFVPNPSSKYKIELTEKAYANKPICQESFHDLNNDSIDERIVVFHNMVKGEAAIKVLTNEGINYEQWNFHGHFQKGFDDYYCADLDNDGFSEIYVFYYLHDSVFMGAVQPYPYKERLFKKKFVATIKKRDGNIDYRLEGFKLTDINNDGFDELLFHLQGGFSRQPRSIFIYDHQYGSFTASKSTGAYFGAMIISDLNNDTIPEIYCGSYTAANIHDSLNIPFNDYSSWLMGFNHNLEFLFPPIQQKAYPSTVNICNFTNKEGESFIAAYYMDIENNKDRLVFYKENTKEYSSITFEFAPKDRKKNSHFIKQINIDNSPYVLVGIIDDNFILYNENLELIKIKTNIGKVSLLFSCNLNKDHAKEFVFQSATSEHLIILDNKLKKPVWLKTNRTKHPQKPINSGIKHNKNKPDELFIKSEDNIYFYTYSLDYFYYLKYPLWILIYGIVVFILWFSLRIQLLRAKRKQEIEETINSLQMKTIKSQMDPHFMFNVLNGLANNVASGNNTEAHNQILRFSQLLRSMMQRTDKIDISLFDEIEFVKNYLELEKFRFKDDFEFSIVIEKGVDTNIRLPRMLIQLLVENSIKHGLWDISGHKKLVINIRSKSKKTLITVEDNGVGRKKAMKKARGTGKGLKLIKDMIALNSKMGRKEITISYTDLYDLGGKAAGTRVDVFV